MGSSLKITNAKQGNNGRGENIFKFVIATRHVDARLQKIVDF